MKFCPLEEEYPGLKDMEKPEITEDNFQYPQLKGEGNSNWKGGIFSTRTRKEYRKLPHNIEWSKRYYLRNRERILTRTKEYQKGYTQREYVKAKARKRATEWYQRKVDIEYFINQGLVL